MKKLGVMVCTNAALDYIPHKYDIPIIRSRILMGDKEYIDYEQLTAEQFYEMIVADPSLFPRTMMAPTGEMLETYEKLRDQGCDEIIFITISNKMSGTYGNAVLAAKMVEGVHVTVFDSLSVGYIEVKMALTACEMAEKGASLEEILKELEWIRDHNRIYFAVDNLKYLVKNGRLSNAAGFVADVLKIKPLLMINAEGAVVSVEKIRTTRRAMERVVEKFLEETVGKEYEPFIIHANNPEGVDFIRGLVLAARPELKEIKDYILTPAVGAHCGPKAMTIGYLLKH
ncbi:MAG TPA: DegV family protein [Candidatus Izemoplasmatales bacterium]|nr:DegV family protein [Candidatus Izemoplasmatales bacterium]